MFQPIKNQGSYDLNSSKSPLTCDTYDHCNLIFECIYEFKKLFNDSENRINS